jgi:hypothetical protein
MWWEYVSGLRSLTGLLFMPRVTYEHGESWLWWFRLGITPDSSTRALWQFYQQRYLGQIGGMDEGVRILPINIWKTCRKILRHGNFSFSFHPKEDVLRIFIALKSPSPRSGLNSRPLGPAASTLTTTQSRRHSWSYECTNLILVHWGTYITLTLFDYFFTVSACYLLFP